MDLQEQNPGEPLQSGLLQGDGALGLHSRGAWLLS